jgi:hypothetical protein
MLHVLALSIDGLSDGLCHFSDLIRLFNSIFVVTYNAQRIKAIRRYTARKYRPRAILDAHDLNVEVRLMLVHVLRSLILDSFIRLTHNSNQEIEQHDVAEYDFEYPHCPN